MCEPVEFDLQPEPFVNVPWSLYDFHIELLVREGLASWIPGKKP